MPTNNDWTAAASTDINTDGNWSLGHKPTSGEIARFVESASPADWPGAATGGARTWGGLYIDTSADPDLSILSGVSIVGDVTIIQNITAMSLVNINGNLNSTVGCNLTLSAQNGACVYSGDCVPGILGGNGSFKWSASAVETSTNGVSASFTGTLISDTNSVNLAGSTLSSAITITSINGGKFANFAIPSGSTYATQLSGTKPLNGTVSVTVNTAVMPAVDGVNDSAFGNSLGNYEDANVTPGSGSISFKVVQDAIDGDPPFTYGTIFVSDGTNGIYIGVGGFTVVPAAAGGAPANRLSLGLGLGL